MSDKFSLKVPAKCQNALRQAQTEMLTSVSFVDECLSDINSDFKRSSVNCCVTLYHHFVFTPSGTWADHTRTIAQPEFDFLNALTKTVAVSMSIAIQRRSLILFDFPSCPIPGGFVVCKQFPSNKSFVNRGIVVEIALVSECRQRRNFRREIIIRCSSPRIAAIDRIKSRSHFSF